METTLVKRPLNVCEVHHLLFFLACKGRYDRCGKEEVV